MINRHSAEARERAARMAPEHEAEHSSRWAAKASIAGKIGRAPETLRLCMSRAERASGNAASGAG
jgi:transposase-like protein